MKTKAEIRARIRQIKKDYKPILTGSIATVQVNAPRALSQISVETTLSTLHPATTQPVRLNCGFCEAHHTAVVAHYEVVRCSCGKFHWALQPRRGGPLRFFPWPGPNLTRAELAERETAAAVGAALAACFILPSSFYLL